ncbi:MAG: hypothetical protein FH749_12255 [Firmicutes bacterium]|nr:hypothetical protein [Bacillota bacterium]
MALEESAQESDTVFDVEGINFVVSEKQQHYFEDVKLDFTENFFGSPQFRFLRM